MDVVEEDGRWLAEEAECDPEEVVSQLREGSARDAPVDGARDGDERNLVAWRGAGRLVAWRVQECAGRCAGGVVCGGGCVEGGVE